MSLVTYPLLRCADPDAPFVWRYAQPHSARQFLRLAQQLAMRLPAHRYALNLCESPYWFLLSFAAVLLRGQTNLLPPGRLASTVANIAAAYPDSYLLSDQTSDQQGDQQLDVTALVDARPSEQNINPLRIPEIPGEHIAAVLFTSGSTGQPQAFAKPWHTLVTGAHCNAQAHGLAFDAASLPTLTGTVPAQHSYGLETLVMLPLQGYGALQSERPFYPQDIAEALRIAPAPRILVSTPVHLRALAEAHPTLPELSRIWSATAPLSTVLAQTTEQQFHTTLHEIFGCTETGTCATRRTAQDDAWTLMPAFTLREAVDSSGIFINADHLPAGAQLQDQIEQLEGRRFRLLGRGADLINIAGKRASLADLNQKLLGIPGVVDGVIFLPDADDATRGVVRTAALVVAPGLEREQVLEALRERIEPAFMPRPLFMTSSLPRNETAKLPRAMLLQYFNELRHASRA